jgi:hypothetical protein
MSSQRLSILIAATLLTVILLVDPCAMVGQAGAGGGHVGGGLAGGGGLSGTGRPTGVDAKDDLRDFHTALAVQATKPQTSLYFAMLRSTEAAMAELHALLDGGPPTDFASRAGNVANTIDAARAGNKSFLDTLSEAQKTGLREETRRLLKADAELEQQSRIFSAQIEAKQTTGNVASSGTALEATITAFHARQIELGQGMDIAAGEEGIASSYDLVPGKTAIQLGNQRITVITSGAISELKASADENLFQVELAADLSELQQDLVEILNSQLGISDRCGETVQILDGELRPSAPVSLLNMQLHFEHWICMRGGIMNEMAEGNGSMEVKFSTSIADDGRPRVVAEISRVEAEGVLGDSLRSALGEQIREKVNGILYSVIHDTSDIKNILPPAALGHTTVNQARFDAVGLGRLILVLDGEVRLSSQEAKVLISELKKQSSAPIPGQASMR